MSLDNEPKRPARRILVVEDEFFLAEEINTSLGNMGYEVVGPVQSVGRALDLIGHESLDGALLDANLNGVSSDPIAAALADRGIRFVVVTGYGSLKLATNLLDAAPRISKPVQLAELGRAMTKAFS